MLKTTPELQEKAREWIEGMREAISHIHYVQVDKSASKWQWKRVFAGSLRLGDRIKVSGRSSAIHEVTEISFPLPGRVQIATKRKKSGQTDSFLMLETVSLLRGEREDGY